MLVLTRRLNETITLGDPLSSEKAIEITIVEVRGDQIRLGISAPKNLPVDRKEIWLQKREERRNAAGPSPER